MLLGLFHQRFTNKSSCGMMKDKLKWLLLTIVLVICSKCMWALGSMIVEL